MSPLRWALIIVCTLIPQAAFVAHLDLFGARGDLMLLLPIAAGIAGGPGAGAYVGFFAGLVFDLVGIGPLGLSALSYCLTGYAVGALERGVLRATWWIPVVSALGGSALGVSTYALVGEVVGQDHFVGPELVTIVAVVALVNCFLVLPAVRLARWALAPAAVPGTATA